MSREFTAILYDAADADRFLAERFAGPALALTPDAHAALLRAGRAPVSSTALYTPARHRRTLVRVRKARRRLRAAAVTEAIAAPVADTLLGAFSLVGSMASRAYETLGGGPWRVPGQDGWQHLSSREAAHLALLRRLARAPSWPPYRTARLAPLVRGLNRLAAVLVAPRQPVLFCNADKGFVALVDRLLAQDDKAVAITLQPGMGDWRDPTRSALALMRLLGGRRAVSLTVPPGPEPAGLRDSVGRALAAIDDPVLRNGLSVFGSTLIETAIETGRMDAPAASLLRDIAPRALMTYSLRWRFEAALGHAAGTNAVPRFLVSHGSHAAPDGATAEAALDDHAEGLLVSRLADVAFVQSPHAEAAAERLMPRLPRARIRPVVWGHRPVATRPAARFRALCAGTYKTWRDHRPWMYETSDEFVAGLRALAEAFATLGPDYELVIRVRPHDECTLESLRALVPAAPNVAIRTGGSFLDDLAEAELLVSHASTTIEEALTVRRPVLLWGGGCPYRHLPARAVPPNNGDRDAVYAVRAASDLPAMISAIAAAHRGRPLTDAELAGHVWPDTMPGVDMLAMRLAALAGDAARRASAMDRKRQGAEGSDA